MALIDDIQKQALVLRKSRSPLASTLTTLKGELETRSKASKVQKPITEADVLAEIRSTLKKIDENIVTYESRDMVEAATMARAERELLEEFMPQQMSEHELRAFIGDKAADGADMGGVMSALKSERAGLYDGKTAATIAKEVISK